MIVDRETHRVRIQLYIYLFIQLFLKIDINLVKEIVITYEELKTSPNLIHILSNGCLELVFIVLEVELNSITLTLTQLECICSCTY